MVIDSSRLIRRFAGCALGLALAWAAPMTAAADRPPPTDPQLADLLSEAVANNPELAAARSERDAAQQRIAPAGALEDPMLELGVINAPLDPLSLRREDMTMKMLGLSQKLPFAGKRDLRRAVATADADSMELAVQEASFQKAMNMGKFQGMISPHTPTGTWVTVSRPASRVGMTCPRCLLAAPA